MSEHAGARERRAERARPQGVLVPFVELEFTHNIGPPPGRYVVRPPDAVAEPALPTATIGPTLAVGSADVLSVRIAGAPPALRTRLRRPRARPAAAGEAPEEVALCIATLLLATRAFATAAEGEAALAAWEASPAESWALAEEALDVVNRAVRAYRCAAADPYVSEVTADDPRAVRVGVGGEGVLVGEWERAFVVPDRPAPRLARELRLRPTEILADVLAGRRRLLAGEDVLLRAVLDLEHDRPEVAAGQLALATELLSGEEPAMAARLEGVAEALVAARSRLGDAATRAPAAADLRALAARIGDAVDASRAV